MSSPTQRTLKYLRDLGWNARVVEYFLRIPGHPAGGVRRDFMGFIDIIAVRGEVTLGVQTTDATSVYKRITKIAEDPALAANFVALERAGWRIEVHGWKRPTKTIRQYRLRTVVLAKGRGSVGAVVHIHEKQEVANDQRSGDPAVAAEPRRGVGGLPPAR